MKTTPTKKGKENCLQQFFPFCFCEENKRWFVGTTEGTHRASHSRVVVSFLENWSETFHFLQASPPKVPVFFWLVPVECVCVQPARARQLVRLYLKRVTSHGAAAKDLDSNWLLFEWQRCEELMQRFWFTSPTHWHLHVNHLYQAQLTLLNIPHFIWCQWMGNETETPDVGAQCVLYPLIYDAFCLCWRFLCDLNSKVSIRRCVHFTQVTEWHVLWPETWKEIVHGFVRQVLFAGDFYQKLHSPVCSKYSKHDCVLPVCAGWSCFKRKEKRHLVTRFVILFCPPCNCSNLCVYLFPLCLSTDLCARQFDLCFAIPIFLWNLCGGHSSHFQTSVLTLFFQCVADLRHLFFSSPAFFFFQFISCFLREGLFPVQGAFANRKFFALGNELYLQTVVCVAKNLNMEIRLANEECFLSHHTDGLVVQAEIAK